MRESTTLRLDRLCRNLHAGEEGMLSLASLFVILGFLVLLGLLVNAGMTTARKVETQNAADAVAYSAAVEMARGMNSITAINHLIGELTALVVLIHTLGGDELDQGKSPPRTPWTLQIPLEVSYNMAKTLGEDSVPVLDDAYQEAKPEPQVGGAIYDARIRLKLVLTWAFEVHFIGGVIAQGQFIPIVGPALEALGDIVSGIALTFETKVYQECLTLDVLEKLARDVLQPVKTSIRDGVIPFLYYYQAPILYATPWQARQAANSVVTPNLADNVSMYPPWPLLQLPVTKDSNQNSPEKSQLMRASTPWIQWWRQEWIDFGKDALLLSRFAAAFEKRSTQYTLSIVKSLLQDKNLNLYVMSNPDPNGRGKTYEPWTYGDRNGSRKADQMFTVVGLAHRPAPRVASPVVSGGGIFRQENPDGMVCYAQAMFYNANPQQRGSGDANSQPTAGWDTLNWDTLHIDGPVPEYPGPVPSGDDTPTPTTPQPRVLLNWQAKLVPTTRLPEATVFQTGPIGRVLWRTIFTSETPLARTH
jgi:hypothetical protein